MKKPLHMLTGVNIGDYEFKPDTIMDVLKKYKFAKEENGGLFRFRSRNKRCDPACPCPEKSE